MSGRCQARVDLSPTPDLKRSGRVIMTPARMRTFINQKLRNRKRCWAVPAWPTSRSIRAVAIL